MITCRVIDVEKGVDEFSEKVSVASNGQVARYFDGQLEIGALDGGTISIIRIKDPDAVAAIQKRGINDPRLKLYGMDYLDLKKVLGEPTEFVLGMATYVVPLADGRTARIMFVLDENKKTSRMTVVQMAVSWERKTPKE